MRIRQCLIVTSAVYAMIAIPHRAWTRTSKELTVHVVDETNAGIASTIMATSSTNIDQRLGNTRPNGEMVAHYACTLGETLWAKPLDPVLYTNSKPRVSCQQDVTLHVYRKETPLGPSRLTFIKVFDANPGTSAGQWAIVSRLILSKQVKALPSTVDPVIKQLTPLGCEVHVTPTIFTSVFKLEASGKINKVAEITSSPASDNNIMSVTGTYNLSCSAVSNDLPQADAISVGRIRSYLENAYARAASSTPHDDRPCIF